MPIVISRSTGDVAAPKLTPEQVEQAWERIIRAFAEKHPEALETIGDKSHDTIQ